MSRTPPDPPRAGGTGVDAANETNRSDRVGGAVARPGQRTAPILLLVAAGLAPWLDVALSYPLGARIESASRATQEAAIIALVAVVSVGALAALCAAVVGVVAAVSERRAARSRGDSDAPVAAGAGVRSSGLFARGAALIAILGLWGPVAAAFIRAALERERTVRDAAILVAAMTAVALVAALVLLARGLAQRSS